MDGRNGANRPGWWKEPDMKFYLTYTSRVLRRQGQYTILILISVAFGVMALVTMQLLNNMIANVLFEDQRTKRGGDLHLERPNDDYLTEANIAELETLRQEGRIETYALISRTYAMLIKPEGGTKTGIMMYAQGVDPDVFPLLGQFEFRSPHGATLAEVIGTPGTIAITRDMADDLDLDVGDPVLVTDGMGGAPQRLILGGVVEMPPSHQAKSAFYSLETARQLANNSKAITGAEVLVRGDVPTLADELSSKNWSVLAVYDMSNGQKRIRTVFEFGLQGAGMLALLVGGIGVANTMQVVLARRSTEVAILKTLGYRRRHLMLLFGLETALIGTVGSLIGIAAALLIGPLLMQKMEGTGIFLMKWEVKSSALISGGLAGVATAIIFGFYAILRASAVRPAAILRHYDTSQSWRQWLSAMGVYAILVIPFAVVSTFIMGSVLEGIGVILLALIGFIALGLFMGTALWITTHLPMPGLGMLRLARNNLKRQPLRLLFGLIALFVGVIAISFAVATISAAETEVDDHAGSLEGPNLVIYDQMAQDAKIQSEISALDGVKFIHAGYLAELAALEVLVDDQWQPLAINWMEGRNYAEPAWGLDLLGAAWGSTSADAYLPDDLRTLYGGLQSGMKLRLRGPSDKVRELSLAGFYEQNTENMMLMMQRSLIVDQAVVSDLNGGSSTAIYESEVVVSKLEQATKVLGTALPDAIVISAADVRAVMQGILFSLLSFVITIAGFALVAGAVLIANAVGLAMIERRREIGVMKTVGYTSRHVLLTLVLEHGQLGVLAGIIGTVAAAIACRVIREAEPEVVLSLGVVPGAAIILVCTGFALISVLAVAWRSTHIPPMVVLRDE
jgi:putative ABC transport system permease protein